MRLVFLASLVIIVTLGMESNGVMYCTTPVFLFVVKVQVNFVAGSLNLYRQEEETRFEFSCIFSKDLILQK